MKTVPTKNDSFWILASITTPYFVRPPHSKVFIKQILKDGNYFWNLHAAKSMAKRFKRLLIDEAFFHSTRREDCKRHSWFELDGRYWCWLCHKKKGERCGK